VFDIYVLYACCCVDINVIRVVWSHAEQRKCAMLLIDGERVYVFCNRAFVF